MMENENKDLQEEKPESPAEETPESPAEEKTFTQAEVDEIVRRRLAREKAKEKDAPEQSSGSNEDLSARAAFLDCKEYVLDNGLSPDILKILDTSNVEAFKEKAEKIRGMVQKPRFEYPNIEDHGTPHHPPDDEDAVIRAAFSGTPHKPKDLNKR